MAVLDATALDRTANLLSSANPSASKYAFVVEVGYFNLATTSSSPSSRINTAASTTPAPEGTSDAPPPPRDEQSTALSGGAIGGIVGGAVGGLALLGAAGFFSWRRRKVERQKPLLGREDVPELHRKASLHYRLEDEENDLELSRTEDPAELEQPPAELDATEVLAGSDVRR